MPYAVQEKSIDTLAGWRTVADHDTEEAARSDALSRALDTEQDAGDRGTAPHEYRVLDSDGRLISLAPPWPHAIERWRRTHP
jgi:hypothetical protein